MKNEEFILKSRFRTIRCLVLGGAILAGSRTSGWALNVSPGRTEIRLAPGKRMKIALSVFNDGKDRLHVYSATKDWFVLPANKINHLTVDTWLKLLGSPNFILKPGENRTVKLTVKCPKNAQGELVGMVSFLYETDHPSMVTPIISVSVYVTASGTEKISGKITDLVARYWKGQFQGAVVVKATGNVHLRPSGQIQVLNPDGRVLADLSIPESDPAYPGMERGYFALAPTMQLKPGRYTLKADLQSSGVHLAAQRGFTVTKEDQIQMDQAKS